MAWLQAALAAKGFMPPGEGMALHRAALSAGRSGLGPIVEIGTYCAKSAIYLGAAARETGVTLFSIDHHRGSEEMQAGWEHHDASLVDPLTGEMDSLPWARRSLRAAGLEHHVVLVVGTSAQVSKAWTTPLSLVFIDGGHGAKPAREDFEGWAPKVAPGGVLAVHDVFTSPSEGGRVPYDLYREMLDGGDFAEAGETGSLRLLRRRCGGPGPRS